MYALSALVLALIGLITAVSLCVQATFIPILYDVKNGRPLILKKDSIANATHHHYQFLVNDILYGPSLRLWNKVMLTNETSTSTPYFSSADYAKLVNARNHSILPSTPLGFATITARYWKDMGDIDNFLAVPRLAEMVYRLLKAGSNSSRSDHKYFTNEIKDMRQRLRSHPLHTNLILKYGLAVEFVWIPTVLYDLVSLHEFFMIPPAADDEDTVGRQVGQFDGFVYHHLMQLCGPLYSSRKKYSPLLRHYPEFRMDHGSNEVCQRRLFFETSRRVLEILDEKNMVGFLIKFDPATAFSSSKSPRSLESASSSILDTAADSVSVVAQALIFDLAQFADCDDDTGIVWKLSDKVKKLAKTAESLMSGIQTTAPSTTPPNYSPASPLLTIKTKFYSTFDTAQYCQLSLSDRLVYPSAWRQVSRFAQYKRTAGVIRKVIGLEYAARASHSLLLFRFARGNISVVEEDWPVGSHYFHFKSFSSSIFSGLMWDGSPKFQRSGCTFTYAFDQVFNLVHLPKSDQSRLSGYLYALTIPFTDFFNGKNYSSLFYLPTRGLGADAELLTSHGERFHPRFSPFPFHVYPGDVHRELDHHQSVLESLTSTSSPSTSISFTNLVQNGFLSSLQADRVIETAAAFAREFYKYQTIIDLK